MNICIYGAARNSINKIYIEAGEQLGSRIAERGHGLVFGGGAGGLMGAVARGAYSKNGYILAVVPSFFNVDGVLFEHSNKTIYTETMRERKRTLEESSDGFIITPGGIGTFDEFFEILTLYSLDRHKKPIAILNTNGYYDAMLSMIAKGVEDGFIADNVDDIYFVSDSVDDVIKHIEENA